MSLFFRERRSAENPRRFPARTGHQVGSVSVSADSALKHSAVWASLRLRADLLSSMPVDSFRKVDGVDVEITKAPVLLNPGGDEWDMATWLWASQFDLDRVGNCFGIITELDGAGRPGVIQLQDHKSVVVHVDRQGVVSYRIKGKSYKASEIWHERQYRLAGEVMGLSAISYAAYSIGMYLSAQRFGIEWFGNGGTIPSGHLKHNTKTLDDDETEGVKERFKLAIADRDVFVTGNDWTYTTIQVAANEGQFIQSQEFSSSDIGRFIGVPGDLIDLAVNGSSVTYANITQRNMQFLIMNLWPAVRRRQEALSRLLAKPRFVRFNTDAILQMDPETKAKVLGLQVKDRLLAPSEARKIDNRQPFTEEQLAEFDVLFPKGNPATKSTTIGD